jgi:hypothetical protein
MQEPCFSDYLCDLLKKGGQWTTLFPVDKNDIWFLGRLRILLIDAAAKHGTIEDEVLVEQWDHEWAHPTLASKDKLQHASQVIAAAFRKSSAPFHWIPFYD